MKILLRLSLLVLVLSVFYNISIGQKIVLNQSNSSGIYKKGETIRVTAKVFDFDLDSISIKIQQNYSFDLRKNKIEYIGDSIVIFDSVFFEPTALIFEVRVKNATASTGLVVDPNNFKPGTKRPKDFKKYWKNEKKALQDLPLKATSIPVDSVLRGYLCYNTEINCTGPKPARGYFAKPESAKSKSLPIVLFVRAAGVKGEWCQSKSTEAIKYAQMGSGALAFDLNAHGMLNGQSQEYYDELEKGELNRYWEIGLESRDEFYFRGMYLRLLRTLDFLCSQPEWDGKRIIVIGESQGGGQALAAAGLDSRVTAAVATVPAMCDFGRALIGEKGGWPNPFGYPKDKEKMKATLPYFDAAHILKSSKATLVTEIGLIDYTCPSNSIYAAINRSKGEKIIYAVPYRGHQLSQRAFQKEWEEDIYKIKMKFIEEFLK